MADPALQGILEEIRRQHADLMDHLRLLIRRSEAMAQAQVLVSGQVTDVPDWARSVYLDNTRGTNPVHVLFDGQVQVVVNASSSVWFPCIKLRTVSVDGTISAYYTSEKLPLASV